MSEHSKIEWTDSTFNPWIGCTKIAPACDHCYAADMAKRYGWVEWGNHPRKRTSAALWAGPRKWQREATAFFAEHDRKRRVFCSSLADVFDNQVPPEWRADLWELIRATPDLNWLLLTKRPQNIEGMLPAFWPDVKGHVWLGTTVEDQEHAEKNVPHLVRHDAAVRFLSCEPMLGHIDLTGLMLGGGVVCDALRGTRVDVFDTTFGEQEQPWGKVNWVIAGGESGPQARPSHPMWFESLRDQCARAGVPFLFKQWGEFAPGGAPIGDHRWKRIEDPMTGRSAGMFRYGKAGAGRKLDGQLHDGFPVAA